MAQAPHSAGFTLIELVIALAIVAITTSFAVTTYRGYLLRSHRIEAAHALLGAAAEQEKFHMAHGHYGDRLDAIAGSEPPGLRTASRTAHGRFRLDVEWADASRYRIVATATDEQGDPLCARMYIDESGRRSALNAGGEDSTAKCW